MLTLSAENHEKTQVVKTLRFLVSVCRAAKVPIALVTQSQLQPVVDAATREICNTKMAFRTGDENASIAI